jgi:hypothetical protein
LGEIGGTHRLLGLGLTLLMMLFPCRSAQLQIKVDPGCKPLATGRIARCSILGSQIFQRLFGPDLPMENRGRCRASE